MKNRRVNLPTLKLHTSIAEQFAKVDEEFFEWKKASSNIESLREIFDLMQAAKGLLQVAEDYAKMFQKCVVDEVEKQHWDKLIKRGWTIEELQGLSYDK